MKKSQVLIILTLLTLLLAINQLFTEPSSLRRYLGGLPWYGWAGISIFLALTGLVFMLRDARRARQLLEEPIEKHITENVQRIQLSQELLEKYDKDGPPYPHPVIIAHLCIGCEACVDACPHNVISMVGKIAAPTARSECMENTACQVACPVDACIVVNTTKPIKPRPVPTRNEKYMTHVPGCYLIGDVSGSPLIKNAINEGADVIKYIAQELQTAPQEPNAQYDVAIIGIGPAGLSAAISAKKNSLKFVGIEQDKVLSTIDAYPKGKDVFFRPKSMEARGGITVPDKGVREEILELWLTALKNHELEINEQESCKEVKRAGGDYFEIGTEKGDPREPVVYRARRVVLAVGNRGTPMKLGGPGKTLPGETDNRVKYKLSNPEEFKQRRVLVVGGGNSAVEAAVALVARLQNGKIEFLPPDESSDVTLVVRNGFTNDIKFANKQRLYHCIDEGKVKIHWDTGVKEIRDQEVVLMDRETQEETARVPNDYILALIGGDRPTRFLKSIGINVPEN